MMNIDFPEIYLEASMAREQTIRAGMPIQLNAIVTGKPLPTISWTKEDQPIEENDHFKMKTNAATGHVNLLIENSVSIIICNISNYMLYV